jgi:hypothetical protein
MADLLHEADHAGIGRGLMLKAVQLRAASKDEAAATDIAEALDNLSEIVETGAWFELCRRAFWLASRAIGGDA